MSLRNQVRRLREDLSIRTKPSPLLRRAPFDKPIVAPKQVNRALTHAMAVRPGGVPRDPGMGSGGAT